MRSRRGLRVLAMCGLVLGMMVISTSGAQAGTWMINSTNVTTTQSVEANVEIEPLGEKIEKHIVLLTTSGANKIEILCEVAERAKGAVSKTTITGTSAFNKCSTKVNGSASAICRPLNQPIEMNGTVEAVLHENALIGTRPFARAKGKATKIIKEGKEEVVFIFAELKFSEECTALPSSVKISGTMWLEDPNFDFETETATHLLREAKVPAGALGGMKFGTNAISLDGSFDVSFSDAIHVGDTFSGLAE